MSENDISELVQRFIQDHIYSVAQLEMLLLLQTNPQQKWTAAEVARELRTEIAGTRQELALLMRSGLIKCDAAENYYFAPAAPELQAATIALAQTYLMRRVTVIGLIFAKPQEGLRAFSDAFRLRKDP